MSLFNVRLHVQSRQHECLQGHAFDLYYVMPTPLIYLWRGLLTCAFQPTRLKSNCAANSAEQPLPTSTTQHLLLSNSTPMFYHVCIMYVGTQKISTVSVSIYQLLSVPYRFNYEGHGDGPPSNQPWPIHPLPTKKFMVIRSLKWKVEIKPISQVRYGELGWEPLLLESFSFFNWDLNSHASCVN